MLFLFRIGYNYHSSSSNEITNVKGILLFTIPWVFLVLYTIFIYLQHFEIRISKIFQYLRPLDESLKKILWEKFTYYQSLSDAEKKRFDNRVHHFMLNKAYIAEGELVLTDEMRTLIAATCVQLGFGLAPIYLAHFTKVIVRPHGTTSTKEIKSKQAILISWKEFEEGFAAVNDGYNPGLHALAVALSLEQQLWGGHHGILGHTPFKRWRQKSRLAAVGLIKTGMTRFNSIRQMDENEYFASAVVYFFEQPDIFHQKFPELYKAMKFLLKQDPRKHKSRLENN